MLLAGAAALAGGAAAAAAAPARTMAVVPGGVVDETARTAYLHGASGGIDAVELAGGRLRWADAEPQRPLAVMRRRLLVELRASDGVRLRIREAGEHGRVLATFEPLPLPAWALASGRVFDSTAEALPGGHVRYRWWAERRRGGKPPEEASGELVVDMARAQVTPSPTSAHPPASALPGGAAMRSAWLVDGVWCALATETRDATSWLMLRRVRADGRVLPTLPVGPATATVARLSTDGRLLVLVPPGGARARSMRLPSGGHGPDLPTASLANAFALVDGLLLVATDARPAQPTRALRAIALDTGAIRWTHPLSPPAPIAPTPAASP
jgi:hypothetical protein